MNSKRRFSRVNLDFPITCTFIDNTTQKILSAIGNVIDISSGGMRISVPIPKPMINSNQLSYSLQLPEPFSTITGKGHIKWSDRDDVNNLIIFGMAFENLNHEHKVIINNIVEELNEV